MSGPWSHMARIHIDTGAVNRREPAIAVVPQGSEDRRPLVSGVAIRCQCGQVAAWVRQHETSAHVLVADVDRVKVES